MLAAAVVHFFRQKVVASIIIIACWSPKDQTNFIRQISLAGLSATFSCNSSMLDYIDRPRLQGVLYFTQRSNHEIVFNQVKRDHFMTKYKWLIVGENAPSQIKTIRYDSDVALLQWPNCPVDNATNLTATGISSCNNNVINIYDVYVHPRDGISLHPWATWTKYSRLTLTHERDRILRRLDLKKYPLKIATPIGHYSPEKYDGTFKDYLDDESMSDSDPGIRSGYQTSMLIVERLNAQDVLVENELWAAMINNNSMYVMLSTGVADLSGAILRILVDRIYTLDYIVAIWPFRVGFTYLAERESSSNMFLEPFSPAVWWTSLLIMFVLAAVQRVTSMSKKEKDGAFYTVLTTWLQQDASAVPEGPSGRWSFTVMSVCAMLVHAYYTSAIVSALMSTGRGGLDTLRALGDSKYAIASEDYDYMRYLFFDVETTWDDLEYLKKKKKTSSFYQDLEKGVEMIEEGNTAFHSEYNQIYPHFKTFSDDHICKLQHVDTIPETLTWVLSSKDGQWTSNLRVAGAWLLETGLGKRLVNRLRILKPPCRAALLAERVKIADITPVLIVSVCGVILAVILLGIEIIFAKAVLKRRRGFGNLEPSSLDIERTNEISNSIINDIE